MPILAWVIIIVLMSGITGVIFEETYFRSKTIEKIVKFISIFVLFQSVIILILGIYMYGPNYLTNDKFYISSEESYTTEIYSIEGSMGIEGRFVLGSGSIEGKQVYEYYYYEDGGYYRDFIYSKNVKIVMNDTETPRIYTIVKEYRFKWFIFHSARGNTREVTETIIYLPEGSIIENYRLN
jgi:hypothetical protein